MFMYTEQLKIMNSNKNMKLTGKCKEDFEKWYSRNYPTRHSNTKTPYKVWVGESWDVPSTFNWLPDSMKWGVLVDFFIEQGIFIEVPFYWGAKFWAYEISETVKDIENHTELSWREDGFKNVQETRIKSIQKANKIYNIK